MLLERSLYMENKKELIDELGQQVKFIFEEDIPKMIKVLSKSAWLEHFPQQFIELINGNKKQAIESIKYAPNIYFELKKSFQNDKDIVRTTIKSFQHHDRIDEIITCVIPLLKKKTIDKQEKIYDVEEQLEKKYAKNYIVSYANLIASNIATTYRLLGNNHNITYTEIYTESQDTLCLNKQDIETIHKLVDKELKTKYKLKIISKDKNTKLIIKKV